MAFCWEGRLLHCLVHILARVSWYLAFSPCDVFGGQSGFIWEYMGIYGNYCTLYRLIALWTSFYFYPPLLPTKTASCGGAGNPCQFITSRAPGFGLQ